MALDLRWNRSPDYRHRRLEPARIYAGMGGGICRSLDSGQTWTKVIGDAPVRRLVIDPANPAILYGGSAGAVYKSLDSGLNWTKSSSGLAGSCTGFLVTPARLYFGSTAGVFRCEDGGSTWSESDLQMSATKILAFASGASSPNTIYAAVKIPTTGNGAVNKSTDAGTSWTPLPFTLYCDIPSAKILVHPWDSNVLWIRDRDLWKSTDGGSTWRGLPARNILDDLSNVAVSQSRPDHLFICGTDHTYQGNSPFMAFERSVDGGTSWSYYPVTSARSSASALAVDPGDQV